MDGNILSPSEKPTYGQVFDKLFPYYLSIGMTVEQYWDDDPSLARGFHEAEQLRLKRRNQELWLQGAYIYEVMARMAPILVANPKKNAKPKPYIEEPYPLYEKKEEIKQVKEEKTFTKGKVFMETFMMNFNKRYEGEH